jgi:hypothetical protein
MNLYVSKLGDDSDGMSWQTAFHTLQTALLSVPDGRGGDRLIVLNFSQPRGEPSTGIIIRYDSNEGRQLHVDLRTA